MDTTWLECPSPSSYSKYKFASALNSRQIYIIEAQPAQSILGLSGAWRCSKISAIPSKCPNPYTVATYEDALVEDRNGLMMKGDHSRTNKK